MKPRFARLAAVATCLVLLGAVLSPIAAQGAPVDDKKAQAAQLQQQIDANGDRISALGERYNGALLAYDQATAQIADAQRRFDAAKAAMQSVRDKVTRRAAVLYKGVGGQSPLSGIDVSNVNEMGARAKYASAAADTDSALIDRLKNTQEDLAIQRRGLEQQQADARAQKDQAAAAKRNIETANAQQQQLLGKVKGEIATLLEQERVRREVAARAAAIARVRPAAGSRSGRAPASGAVDPGSVGGNFPNIPTSGGVASVIAYARAQLGKPYVFATAGPATFDCSGLTMMAWRQAGVSMNHFSGSQFQQFPHVSIGALQPGDLVFKGPGGADHVALYIGGGMQIAATHTGDYVRLQPLGSNLSGAVRPG